MEETIPLNDFLGAWSGNVLLSFPEPTAAEPGYAVHARIEFFMRAKKWLLAGCLILLFAYLFVTNGIYRHLSTILVSAIDLVGLWLTYMLVKVASKDAGEKE